jgi:multisubunit Na+/H+ antiporter MnhF subunit
MITKAENLARHILPTSATMVGVCMTVISIIKLLHLGRAGTWIDKLLALDSLIFLASAMFSYISLRKESMALFESYADTSFMLGLTGMASCAFLLAFELV